MFSVLFRDDTDVHVDRMKSGHVSRHMIIKELFLLEKFLKMERHYQ